MHLLLGVNAKICCPIYWCCFTQYHSTVSFFLNFNLSKEVSYPVVLCCQSQSSVFSWFEMRNFTISSKDDVVRNHVKTKSGRSKIVIFIFFIFIIFLNLLIYLLLEDKISIQLGERKVFSGCTVWLPG